MFVKFILLLILTITSALAAKTEILFISDSRGNCSYGQQMVDRFKELPNVNFEFISVGGSSARTWMLKHRRIISPYGHHFKSSSETSKIKIRKIQTPYFPAVLEKSPIKKDLVVITLGGNSFNKDILKKNAIDMIDRVHQAGAKCAWVGPAKTSAMPVSKTQWQVDAIKEAIVESELDKDSARCMFIDSREYTHYPFSRRTAKTDGVHYCWHPVLIEIGKEWANEVYAIIEQEFAI